MDIIASFFQASRLGIDADPGVECRLHPNRPLRLTRARGRHIRCTSGCAWVTAPGMADDVFLHAGETWRIEGNGLVLVEAIGFALIEIDAFA